MGWCVPIKGANLRLGAPPGEEDRVYAVEAFRNRGAVITRWELSPEEIVQVLKTGTLYVAIWGGGMPPILVGDEDSIRDATAEGGILPRQDER